MREREEAKALRSALDMLLAKTVAYRSACDGDWHYMENLIRKFVNDRNVTVNKEDQ